MGGELPNWTFKDLLFGYIVFIVGQILGIVTIARNPSDRLLFYYYSSLLTFTIPFMLALFRSNGYRIWGLFVFPEERGPIFLGSLLGIGLGVIIAYMSLGRLIIPEFTLKYSFFSYLLLPLSGYGFCAIVLAPICEEVFFRGFTMSVVSRKYSKKTAIFTQAFLFGIFHVGYLTGESIYLIIPRILVGLLCGYYFLSTNSLIVPIFVHGFSNFAGLLFWGLIKR